MGWTKSGSIKGPKGDDAGGVSLPVGTLISCPNNSTANLNVFAAALGDDWRMTGNVVLSFNDPIFDTSGNIMSDTQASGPRRLIFFIKVK